MLLFVAEIKLTCDNSRVSIQPHGQTTSCSTQSVLQTPVCQAGFSWHLGQTPVEAARVLHAHNLIQCFDKRCQAYCCAAVGCCIASHPSSVSCGNFTTVAAELVCITEVDTPHGYLSWDSYGNVPLWAQQSCYKTFLKFASTHCCCERRQQLRDTCRFTAMQRHQIATIGSGVDVRTSTLPREQHQTPAAGCFQIEAHSRP